VAEDPFGKVKTLIQGLIDRLLAEAAQEATKQGYCDLQVGRALKKRDFRFRDLEKMAARMGSLVAREKELKEEIEELEEELEDDRKKLNETAKLRKEEKEENLEVIQTAKEGLQVVSKAITMLKVHYKQAAKGKVLLQARRGDGDSEEKEAPDTGFSGAYKGNQDGILGVIKALDDIKADFEDTARKMEEDEKKAAEDFVKFDRTARVEIKGKETQVKLDKQSLTDTKNAIKQLMEDMETAQGLLDDALKTLEELRPICMDTGMSFAERSARRDEEVAALKQALCFLDPSKKDSEC